MDKFQNKYRIPSARAPFWDYGWNASYFVTICTYNHICYFGEIVDGEMVLSDIGEIVNTEWLKTFEMRPDMNLYMGEYVIMPNHFHAIINIGENKYNTNRDVINTQNGGNVQDGGCRDAMHCVSTTAAGAGSDITHHNQTKNKFGPQSKNLSSIIRGFKIGVTKNARIIDKNFAWQPRFHDHIIRTDKAYQRIAEYIDTNVGNWERDKFYEP